MAALLAGCSVADVGVLLEPPPGGTGDADPTGDTDGGPPDAGMRDGGDGGPPPLEDPGACTMLPYYGQSSSVGVCSGTCSNFGNPPCDVPGGSICNILSDADLDGAFQAAWDYRINDYGEGVCPLNVRGGAGCSRGNAEVSAYGMLEQYRAMRGQPTQATFTSIAGQSGTGIAELDRGEGVTQSDTFDGYQPYYARLMRSIVAVRDAVAAEPERYGCNGRLVVRGLAMTQGETDDPIPEGYDLRVRRFVDNFCEDVKSLTGQRECPHVSWDQTSGWLSNGDALAPTAQRLLDATDPDPRFHSIGGKGQYNPGTPGKPFLGETNPDGVHSWENEGASPLHFSSLTQKHVGRQHGKILYRGIHLGEDWNGLRMNALTQAGRVLTACFSPVGGRIVRDVESCPPHWNGTDGFEWYQDEIGAPRILRVTQSGPRCVDLEMSEPVANVASGRLQAGFRGLLRIGPGEEPENGCRAAGGDVNHGSPGWTNWRDVDPADFGGDGAAYNWVAIQAKPLDLGGVPAAPDSSAAYFAFDEGTEGVTFADDPALSSNALTISWWARHDALENNAIVLSKWGELLIRRRVDGEAVAYNAMFASSGGNSSVWVGRSIPRSSDWKNIVMVYDGSQVATERIRWFVDCVEVDDVERATIPASLPDTPGLVTIGDGQSRRMTARDGIRDVAIWTQVLDDSQLLRVCRSRSDLRSLGGVPVPRYFVRPTCDDDLTTPGGVANLGTLGNAGSGRETEAADRVIDRPDVCNGLPDAGVRDAGPPRDGGVRDGGVPATVPNIFGIECDGIDDRVTYGPQTWLHGKNEALVCFLIREPELGAATRPLGHWGPNAEQWSVMTNGADARFYVASGSRTERYAATEGDVVAGPHQLVCARYDLAQTDLRDEVRVWRNGVPVTIDATEGGVASVFTSPSSPGFSLCAEHGGGAEWAGVIDEVAIWLDGNIPTDAQIADEITFDATPWDCELPNWRAGGLPTARPPDVSCRFESSFDCEDANGVTVARGTPIGGATFTTDVACSGRHDNFTSLAPAAGDMWRTTGWIQDPTDQNLVLCWTSEAGTAVRSGAIASQIDAAGAVRGSWGIVQRDDAMRVQVPNPATTEEDWVEFSTAPAGRHNYCAVFSLGSPVVAERVRLVEDCVPITVAATSGLLPSSFTFEAARPTTIAGANDGTSSWGGSAHRLDNLVVWREQDGEPSFAQVLSTVCFDPEATDAPSYDTLSSVPAPGCWFTLDGDLSDRLTNCGPLVQQSGATRWPNPARPLD